MKNLNFGILLILFLAFLVRINNIDRYGIWYDEKVSLLAANGMPIDSAFSSSKVFRLSEIKSHQGSSDIVHATIVNDSGNTILYNLILHIWKDLAGNTDFSIRFLSVLFSLLNILLIYYFCKKYISYEAAILAAILFSLCPLFVSYAQQARGYTPAVFLSLSSSIVFWKLFFDENLTINSSLKRLGYEALYVILLVASLLTHYLTVYIFIAHFIFALGYMRNIIYWKRYFAISFFAAAIFYFWLSHGGLEGFQYMNHINLDRLQMAKIAEKQGLHSQVSPSNFYFIFAGILNLWLQETGNGLLYFFRGRIIGVLILLPFSVLFYFFLKNKFTEKTKKISAFFSIIFITQSVFVILLAIQAKHDTSLQSLYAIFSTPYALALYAIALAFLFERQRPLAYLLIFLQITISVSSLLGIYFDKVRPFARERNPYLNLAEQINKEIAITDTLVFPNHRDAQVLSLYLKKDYILKIDTSLNRNAPKPIAIRTAKNRVLVKIPYLYQY